MLVGPVVTGHAYPPTTVSQRIKALPRLAGSVVAPLANGAASCQAISLAVWAEAKGGHSAVQQPLSDGPLRRYARSLVSGKVLCGGQQTLSIQCRGGNLSGKRFEWRAAENWAGAPLPRFSTMRDAHRPVRFLRVDRPSPSPGVSEMRGPLRRSSSAEEAFLLGSVLGDGLRATDLPREPAGHRSLPPIRDRETLSPGVSRHGGAQHSGRRQRNTRLAHLRRVCPCLD